MAGGALFRYVLEDYLHPLRCICKVLFEMSSFHVHGRLRFVRDYLDGDDTACTQLVAAQPQAEVGDHSLRLPRWHGGGLNG